MSEPLTIQEVLERLRHDEDFHTGLGDIRLTIGQQEWIETREQELKARIAELEERYFVSKEELELMYRPMKLIQAEGIREMGLPVIDDDMWEMFNDTCLMTWDREANRPDWTQTAVDIVAYLCQANADKLEASDD